MLGLIGPYVERTKSLFDVALRRAYAAAVIGRQTTRAPYGALRLFTITSPAPVELARNDSKARALRVYVESRGPGAITAAFGASLFSVGGTAFSSGNNGFMFTFSGPDKGTQQYVLLPGEQLFMAVVAAPAQTPTNPPRFATATEWT